MNGPIRKVAVLMMVMFATLMLNLSYSYVFRTPSLAADSHNRRVTDSDFNVHRGDILVGSTAIAASTASSDRYAYQRTYSNGALYAPVTGYYSFVYGRSGLEQTQNGTLSGASDSQFLQRVVDLATGKRPAGATIQTTLDARAQQAAAQALGNRPGAVVAIDYKTGAILAMVTSPSYDPNKLATHDATAATASWQALTTDATQPMLNRATKNVYPPGSTFKLVVSAAALGTGMTPDTMVDSPDSLTLPNTSRPLSNSDDCGGTKITLTHALEVSCNTAFGKLGMTLGQDALRAQAEKFGFGSTAELPQLGAVASRFPSTLDQAQLAMSSIGQYDVAATPLQMAMVGAGIANDGVVMQPYLVQQVQGADLSILSKAKPTEFSTAMTPANAKSLQSMMLNVVANGTGARAQIDGVKVGGKTGTATSDGKRAPYAWFVAWADNPSVAIAVFVQDAGITSSEISGGRISAPIARTVIEALR